MTRNMMGNTNVNPAEVGLRQKLRCSATTWAGPTMPRSPPSRGLTAKTSSPEVSSR